MVNFNKEVSILNIGEKICLFKERLSFRNFQEFGRAADVSGDWINELSKKSEIKVTDMNNIIKLSEYLGITIDQLVKNDEFNVGKIEDLIVDINDTEDIGVLINNMILLLKKDEVKMNNVLMNEKSRKVCEDSLNVVKVLVKQHL